MRNSQTLLSTLLQINAIALLGITNLANASLPQNTILKDSISKVIESRISTGKYLGKRSDNRQDCVVTVGSYGADSKNISIKIEDIEDFSQLDGQDPLVLFDYTEKTKETKREINDEKLLIEIKDNDSWIKSHNTLLDVSGSKQSQITVRIEEGYGFLRINSKSISCDITNDSRLSEKISFQN